MPKVRPEKKNRAQRDNQKGLFCIVNIKEKLEIF